MNPEIKTEKNETETPRLLYKNGENSPIAEELRSETANSANKTLSSLEHEFETETGKKFNVEVMTSETLDPQTLREFTDFYRFMFSNSFGGQYLVYPSIGTPITPQDVFGIEPKEFVPLEKLDKYNPSDYPKHPETDENAVFWHDPEATYYTFLEKSKEGAHFAYFRDSETGKIAGILFGHKCTIKDLFATEEWENPLLYSGVKVEENQRDFNKFLNELNKQLEINGHDQLDENSYVYGWNCIATHPDARGLENLMRLTTVFFNTIPEKMHQELLIVGETQFESRAHYLFKSSGGIDIPGILKESDQTEKDDPIIMVAPLSKTRTNFAFPKELFEQLIKT